MRPLGDSSAADVRLLGSLSFGAETARESTMCELRRNGDAEAIGLGIYEWEACDAAMDCDRWDVFLFARRHTLLEPSPLDRSCHAESATPPLS